MRRIRSFLPIGQMAGIALRRESQKHSGRRLFMAGIALHRRVRAKQWEAILVVAYLLR